MCTLIDLDRIANSSARIVLPERRTYAANNNEGSEYAHDVLVGSLGFVALNTALPRKHVDLPPPKVVLHTYARFVNAGVETITRSQSRAHTRS